MKKNFIILFTLIVLSISATAQKGSIKIFSEIKGINIYLDEIFQGTDIVTIDSVQIGTHYLKVMKDSVILYGELVTIQTNKLTTVLIKNSSEVKNKLLESKTSEIQKYKNNKLDVILSQNYVTQTKGVSSSYYFPGYYITTGTGYYNSVTSTSAYTDWKIIQGGNKVISEMEFAKLTGDKNIEENYNYEQAKFQEEMKAYNKKTKRGIIIAIPSMIISGIIAADLLGSKSFLNMSSTTEAVIGTAGIVGSVIGYSSVINTKVPSFNPGHFTTVEQASKEAYEYNQALKKQLGLPKSFELHK